jgi:glycosyltransferase involved in cell wall biosynthesis
MNIGIGITTHNRNKAAEHTIEQIKRLAPKGAKIVIVDDASNKPNKYADFVFKSNVGIAAAKNKCFELLDNCDYIFLFDDDCYPIVEDWHLPYINSGENHLMMIFDKLHNGKPNGNRKRTDLGNLSIYENPCGCMLFYTKKCLQLVGGMDTEYGKWGFEHADLSVRIFNAGLTKFKFVDVKNSLELFYSHDYYISVERSVPANIRNEHIRQNQAKYNRLGKSKHYIDYKQSDKENVIITTYFNSVLDTQRGQKWTADLSSIMALVKSCQKLNIKLIVLTDCFYKEKLEGVEFVYHEPEINPYFERWNAIYTYLKSKDYGFVFCVDATDVEVLKNPFLSMKKDLVYVGCETGTIGSNRWLYNHHSQLKFMLDAIRHKQIINAGLLGGSSYLVSNYCNNIMSFYYKYGDMYTDMAAFNIAGHTKNISFGKHVNTVFKKFEKNNLLAWFKHK